MLKIGFVIPEVLYQQKQKLNNTGIPLKALENESEIECWKYFYEHFYKSKRYLLNLLKIQHTKIYAQITKYLLMNNDTSSSRKYTIVNKLILLHFKCTYVSQMKKKFGSYFDFTTYITHKFNFKFIEQNINKFKNGRRRIRKLLDKVV